MPDCPGFGVSPLPNKALTVEETADVLHDLIKKVSGSHPIGLIAHSLGGLVGTWLCQKLSQQVIGFINVEGNLTKADCFFSGKTNDLDSAEKFYTFFTKEILQLISEKPQEEALKRYYASIRFAHPEALLEWGKSGVKATGITKAGEEFAFLKCKTIYFWGDRSTPEETRNFIQKRGLKNICFKNSGHVPMIDATDKCYQVIFDFFQSALQ